MTAMRLPKNTDNEKKIRNLQMQEGLKKAVEVPLKVMRTADGCWDSMKEMAKYGNLSSASDLEVGAKCLETGIWGAFKNVKINLPQINDENYKSKVVNVGNEILERAVKNLKQIERLLEKRN